MTGMAECLQKMIIQRYIKRVKRLINRTEKRGRHYKNVSRKREAFVNKND